MARTMSRPSLPARASSAGSWQALDSGLGDALTLLFENASHAEIDQK